MNTLNQLAFIVAPVFYKLLAMSITASAVGFLLLLIRHFADEKISPRWKYTLWAVVIAALVIPYRRESERALMPSMNAVEKISYRKDYDYVKDVLFIENQRIGDSIQPSAEKLHEMERMENEFYMKSLLVDAVVPLVWFFGMCFMLLWWIVVKIRLEREIRKKGVASLVDVELLQICQESMGVREQAECIVLSEISSPALVGIFRPRILLPDYVSTLGEESLSYILMHELAHFKRKDMWVNLLLLGLRAVYWFNPLIWILFHRIREDMELRNDDYVLERIDPSNQKSYARSLVEVLGHSQKIPWMALCMIDGKKNVERRIHMIKLSEVFRKRRNGITVLGISLLVLLTACFFTESKPLSSNRNWANNLKAEEILRLEMVVTSEESNQKYHRFGKAEVGEVVDWIRGFDGDLVSDQSEENETKDDSAYNGESVDFYILTRDRTMHTIRIDRNVFIDGEAYHLQEDFLKACPKEKATAPVPEYFHYGERREAFKGLELYVWKDGEGKPRFSLLPGTNALKAEAQIYDEKASTSDLDDVAAELAMEKDGLYLSVLQMNRGDFTKEELDKLLEPLTAYLPKNWWMSTGLYEKTPKGEDGSAMPREGWESDPEELWESVFHGMENSPPRVLKEEEIENINLAFMQLLPRDPKGEKIILNPLCHFFSSRYERPEEMDFSEFLWYFPGEEMSDEKEEDVRQFELLKKIPDFPFASAKTLSDTISPLRRVSRASVNEVLSYYAGITAEQLINQKNVLYLKEWDSYYVYSSDFGAGYFNCASGEITEDGIQLTSEEGARLRLEYRDGRFLIRSHTGGME